MKSPGPSGLPESGPPESGAQVMPAGLAAESAIRRMRARLLGGYGPGASEAMVTAGTRDWPVIAARPTVVGLEERARQAGQARGTATAVLRRLLRLGRAGLTVIGAGMVLIYALVRAMRRGGGPSAKGGVREGPT
ncbi:hypothetical protein [Arthrobacter sp.]|jgi:hypothetical protein|uniref:hypothetical protein n=1 Tax=Arthrobacter sp. TaxID=1667 RepID=UPI00258C45E9|nr:hypothetical protein [Arthrobacter sp.]